MRQYIVVFAAVLLAILHSEVKAEPVDFLAIIDNGYEVYINGAKFELIPGKVTSAELNEGDVVAVKIWDIQGGTRGGFAMAMTRKDGSFLVTDTKWRWSATEVADWMKQTFDDSKWERARKVEREWMKVKESFPGKARPELIWGKGATVYLRRVIHFAEFKGAHPSPGK